MSGSVSVSGGLDGISARPDQLRAASVALRGLAECLDEAGATCAAGYWGLWTTASIAAPASRVLLDAVQESLDRVQGVLGCAAQDLRHDAGAVAAAAALYELTDDGVFPALGAGIGAVWSRVEPGLAGLLRAPGAAADAITLGLATGSASRGTQAFATADPQLLDTLLDADAAAERASPQFRLAVRGVEAFLDQHFDDGRAQVAYAGADTSIPARLRPREVGDLIDAVAWRDDNEQAAQAAGARGGEIDVKFLAHADGSRSVIVNIPGTKDWSGAGHDRDVTNMATNLRAIRGLPTAYEQGVLEAMTRAGVRPGDHVMLVGHSLGGMIAVNAAREAVRSGRFDVTHVLTAGSPIGRTAGALPPSVRLLALENTHDAVPELDGRANPSRPNVVTARDAVTARSLGAAHGLDSSYERVAADVDASDDPALRYYIAGAQEFLDADAVDTQRYVITRGY